jgi:hypothetical protein
MNVLDNLQFWKQKSDERAHALDDIDKDPLRWHEIFPHDEQRGVVWADLPSKCKKGKSDLAELEAAIKECRPIIAAQKKVDLKNFPGDVDTSPIILGTREADEIFERPARTRDAIQKLDTLTAQYLSGLDFTNGTIENRAKVFSNIISGLAQCRCCAERLREIVRQNDAAFAFAQERRIYWDSRNPNRKIVPITEPRKPVTVAPVSTGAPRVDSTFNVKELFTGKTE